MSSRGILIEGMTAQQIAELTPAELDGFVLSAQPIVFRAGTSEILAQFTVEGDTLRLELGHIDGGGEGVLPVLASAARKCARNRALQTIDWVVYAVSCPRPNLKLRRVLERRGFQKETFNGIEAFRMMERV